MQVPASNLSLKRLDNCTWSCQRSSEGLAADDKMLGNLLREVRIETPYFSRPGCAYELAMTVAKAIQSSDIFSLVQNKKPFILKVNGPEGLSRWLIKHKPEYSDFISKYFQWIPFIKTYPSRRFVTIQVQKVNQQKQPWLIHKVQAFVHSLQRMNIERDVRHIPIEYPLFSLGNFSERLKLKPFDDPFTQIAAKALQTVETRFVSEQVIQGACRIVLTNHGRLQIVPLSMKGDPEENQRTVQRFRDFMLKEYGAEHIEYAQYAYGFDLNEMIKKSMPLLPDHVFKMNVGVNNVEMAHVENLFKKLQLLRLHIASHPMRKPLEEVLRYYHSSKAVIRLSMREIRGLLKAGKGAIVDETSLMKFLDHLAGDEAVPDHLPHMSPERFNTLMEMLWLAPEDLSRALTGRMITHLAICGYKTMGNSSQEDPCRDQAELMQIFPDMQTTEDWDNFYELLSHVAVKKNLFRVHRGENGESIWRTGVLIPAPRTKDQTNRWFYVSKVFDDGHGNFSYILLPATKGFKLDGRPLPMIHLYRSTNSDPNAIDWFGSIENDLNPFGPGTSGEVIPQNAKGGFFFNRTIPLWVALMIYGDSAEPKIAIKSYREALLELKHCLEEKGDERAFATIDQLLSSENAQEIRAFLIAQAEKTRELPKDKKAQDIVFVGHSLGGALAQYGIHYFGPGARRIPCPGYHFICRAYDGPATQAAIDEEFLSFGRKYRNLLEGLGQRWKIFHQFEYGDFVPEAGETHLGASPKNFAPDRKWLDVHIRVFQPMEKAGALTITTCPTHGRRIGQAFLGSDYQLNALSPDKLYQYHHALFLSGDLKKLFGYQILISPRITEIFRRVIGLSLPALFLGSFIYQIINPSTIKRDSRGVFSCDYRAAPLQPQY